MPVQQAANPRLAILLAMAMFVLVVDTSLMNVSISAVVARSRHDRQRRPVGDRARGAGVGRVHPDRQQGRRPDRPQAGLRAGSARLRDRRPGDGARPEPDRDHHLLGDHRRARRVAAAAGDAVADPRQLRGRGAEEGLRAGRRGGRDRRRGRAAARRLHHHLPVVARRRSCSRSSSSRSCCPASSSSATCRTPGPRQRRRRRRGALGPRHGRHRAGHPRVAGGRRSRRRAPGDRRGRDGGAGLLARAAQARGQADADRPGPVQVASSSGSGSPSRCSSRSPWAAR